MEDFLRIFQASASGSERVEQRLHSQHTAGLGTAACSATRCSTLCLVGMCASFSTEGTKDEKIKRILRQRGDDLQFGS